MSKIFANVFLILFFLALIKDWKKITQTKARYRLVYGFICCNALAIFFTTWAGYDLPMPTIMLTKWIVPWAKTILPR